MNNPPRFSIHYIDVYVQILLSLYAGRPSIDPVFPADMRVKDTASGLLAGLIDCQGLHTGIMKEREGGTGRHIDI